MLMLSIRYTLNPNKIADFKTYVEAEEPIRRSGGISYRPTSAAPPTKH